MSDPKNILKEAESVTANVKHLRNAWSDYVQSGSFQKECDGVFTSASNLKVGERGRVFLFCDPAPNLGLSPRRLMQQQPEEALAKHCPPPSPQLLLTFRHRNVLGREGKTYID